MSVKDSLAVFDHKNDPLSKGVPVWLDKDIRNWITETMIDGNWICDSYGTIAHHYSPFIYLNDDIHSQFQYKFRDKVPSSFNDFLTYVIYDVDKLILVLDILLKKFGWEAGADLEEILSHGSAYAARKHKNGSYSLEDRVPEVIQKKSAKALDKETELNHAWSLLYGQNPDFAKVVQKSQNVLEKVLRDNYFPDDRKPQFGRMIKQIRENKELKFIGSKILDDSNILLSLIEKISEYREMHTAGNGKSPDREIATYFLHTTIHLWNLHNSSN